MDKPTTPDGQNASAWPEESGSEQGFGATGVFRVVQDVKKPEPAQGLGSESYFQDYRAPEPPRPVPPPPLAEPVVHKVVLGAGAESSSELLDRMRLASAERPPVVVKAPAPPAPGGQGSGGFTALLRTLENEPAPPAIAPKETPAPPAQSSGFTSLLRTLDAQEATPAPDPIKTAPPPAQFARPIPEEPVRTPAAPSPGGFTELLRTTSGDFGTSALPMQRPGPVDAPAFGGAAGVIPTAPENKAGAFTQLFSSFGGEAGAPAPPPIDRAPTDSSRGNAGSFTRMLSLEPQLAPQLAPQFPASDPSFREERRPLPGSVDYGNTPGMGSPAAANRDPFAPAPVVESKPADSAPPGGSVGITRLIQMLDEPTKPAAPRVEAAPPSPSPSREPGPGAWTQTFAALSTPSAPAAPPAASTPAWPPPPIPAQPMPAAPAGASGPSEFTRILDASRMRELAMQGGSGAAGVHTPPQAPLPPPPPAMPSYQVPPPPPMQGMGVMPHPSAYPPPPPPAPAYPMSYAPPAGAPAPGGSMPQAPGMYAPAPPPMPTAPPPPAAKPPEPGVGKIQQLVPMLLVVVIVLLIVLIVTVIFLMKH